MKKLIIIITLIAAPIISFAQSSFGIKVGYVNSYISNPAFYSSIDYLHRNGLMIGGLFNYGLNKSLSLQAEVLYTQKGYINNASIQTDPAGNPIGSGKVSFNYNYLEVPLLIKAQFGNNVKPYIMSGVSPSLKVVEKNVDEFKKESVNDINKFDLAFIINGGIDFKVSEKTFLFIESRATLGMVPIFDNYKYKNISLAILAGVRF